MFPYLLYPLLARRCPTSCYLEGELFLEVVQCFKRIFKGYLLLRPLLPCWPILRSKYQVIVANDFRIFLAEDGGEQMLQIVLVSNEQVTVGTVAACLVQR